MSRYVARIVPMDASALPQFLNQEFVNVMTAWSEPDEYRLLKVLSAAPKKPIDGMEVLADGTNWNPGSGAGRYYYLNNSWHFMG